MRLFERFPELFRTLAWLAVIDALVFGWVTVRGEVVQPLGRVSDDLGRYDRLLEAGEGVLVLGSSSVREIPMRQVRLPRGAGGPDEALLATVGIGAAKGEDLYYLVRRRGAWRPRLVILTLHPEMVWQRGSRSDPVPEQIWTADACWRLHGAFGACEIADRSLARCWQAYRYRHRFADALLDKLDWASERAAPLRLVSPSLARQARRRGRDRSVWSVLPLHERGLRLALAELRADGVPVVLIDAPRQRGEHRIYTQPGGPESYSIWLQQFALSESVPLVDWSQSIPEEMFYDGVHLHAPGRRLLADRLAALAEARLAELARGRPVAP